MCESRFPKRKPTRWSEIDYSTAGFYFLTICTHHRRHILSTIVGGGALDAPFSANGEIPNTPVGGGAFDAPRPILTPIGKIVEKHLLSSNKIKNLTIEQYVIMPNHIHIIVGIHNNTSQLNDGTSRAPSPTVGMAKRSRANALIPHFVSTFKRFCNAEIGKNIFQRSFHDHVIRNGREYEEIAAYVARNPWVWREDCLWGEGELPEIPRGGLPF